MVSTHFGGERLMWGRGRCQTAACENC